MVSAPAHGLLPPTPIDYLRAFDSSGASGLSLAPDHKTASAARGSKPLIASVERGGLELIDRLASEWRTLCAEANTEPFLHPDWLRTYLATRAPDARLAVVTAHEPHANGEGELRAVLPLIDEHIRLAGVPLRRWRSVGDTHSPERFDLVARPADRVAAVAAVWDALRAARGWDLIELAAVPPGAAALALRDLAAADGAPVAARVAITTPYIPLATPDGRPDLPTALAGATTKFKANLRRRRRNLEQLGPIRLVRTEHYDEVLIDQFLSLESSGWKGTNGTAISSNADTDAFFRRMARVAADNGWLTIYALTCGDRPVAIHLGLTWPGPDGPGGASQVYGVPKLAYDESLATCAPGHLLVGEILADLVARGVAEFDFLANDAPWKREWTDALRPCERLYVFRPTPRAHLAHTLRFHLFPAARQKKLALDRHLRSLRSSISNHHPPTTNHPSSPSTLHPQPTTRSPR